MTGSDGAKPRRPLDLAFPLRLVVGAGFGMMVVLTIAQVIFRFVFDSPLVWSEELARLLLVWVTLLGGAVVCWDGAHLSVDALFVKLPRPVRRYVRIFNGAVAIAFLVVLSYFSIEMVMIEHITTLGFMDIPASFVRVPATIDGALMIIFIVLRWVDPTRRNGQGNRLSTGRRSPSSLRAVGCLIGGFCAQAQILCRLAIAALLWRRSDARQSGFSHLFSPR